MLLQCYWEVCLIWFPRGKADVASLCVALSFKAELPPPKQDSRSWSVLIYKAGRNWIFFFVWKLAELLPCKHYEPDLPPSICRIERCLNLCKQISLCIIVIIISEIFVEIITSKCMDFISRLLFVLLIHLQDKAKATLDF